MEHIDIHFKGEEQFVQKILHHILHCIDYQTFVLTEFLSPYHQKIVQSLVNSYDELQVVFDGGIRNSENKRAIIAPKYFIISLDDFQIDVLTIHYKQQFTNITHADVLGALMSTNIKRHMFGDIVVHQGTIFVACNQKISSLVQMEVTKIKKTTVIIQNENKIVEAHNDFDVRQIIVASYRIDVLLSAIYKISRSISKKYIHAGYVKVNHKVVVESDFLCHNDDVISLRKYGRVKIVYLNKTTRNNNYVIECYFYK